MIKADDGDGYTDTVTVEIATAEPTATPKIRRLILEEFNTEI
jgi:hypothetical protein